jgi:hypothetical protein
MKFSKIVKKDKLRLVFIVTENQVKRLINKLIAESKNGRI